MRVLLLAFDTATPAITVALHDGAAVLAESTTVDARRTGELLAPGITAVLDAAGHKPGELTGIAVGVGPGPFTGLRVGLVTARALGDSLGIPVHGVCTLDVVAYQARSAEPFAVATDARRREVYYAQYADYLTRSTEPDVAHPALIADRLSGLPVAGEGAVLYSEAFPQAIEPRHPSAAALAELVVLRLKSDPDSLLFPEPLYLRRPDAVEPSTRKRVSTG
ncbi:tRNA (adenosine(37)-N6)-threonylcarbamoyltransferase complex dimerization subunit type 1 TsaB [Catenulispora yoronensis]|uniref:tRNA (Adenosine(37)-N6)-threonylcarbamoyltransferase complex dimerization subunit type 1 TsaB n=1 Tax=Catenulispora yoronensis TaxID=450799 RepID=A0ABP5FE34_9ACTN